MGKPPSTVERRSESVGFGSWHRDFDPFWAMYGGDADGLYVKPRQRGLGIAPAIIAALMCAQGKSSGLARLSDAKHHAGSLASVTRSAMITSKSSSHAQTCL